MGDDDRFVDTVSVSQTTNSTYSINQVLAGGFDARANLQVNVAGTGRGSLNFCKQHIDLRERLNALWRG